MNTTLSAIPSRSDTGSVSLRVRLQDDDVTCVRSAPFVQSGRLTAFRAEGEDALVEMQVGRNALQFHLKDFSDLFEGIENARYLLQDAVQHQDYVEIRVLSKRLSYRNQAQYERFTDGSSV